MSNRTFVNIDKGGNADQGINVLAISYFEYIKSDADDTGATQVIGFNLHFDVGTSKKISEADGYNSTNFTELCDALDDQFRSKVHRPALNKNRLA